MWRGVGVGFWEGDGEVECRELELWDEEYFIRELEGDFDLDLDFEWDFDGEDSLLEV